MDFERSVILRLIGGGDACREKKTDLIEKNSDLAGEGALQMRRIFCSARSHSETIGDTGDSEVKDKNPGECQGYVAAYHPEDTGGKVEATGRQ